VGWHGNLYVLAAKVEAMHSGGGCADQNGFGRQNPPPCVHLHA